VRRAPSAYNQIRVNADMTNTKTIARNTGWFGFETVIERRRRTD
jgi:hypothetical protein